MKTAAPKCERFVCGLAIVLMALLISNCEKKTDTIAKIDTQNLVDHYILGKWVRQSQRGPIRLNFMENGFVETDKGMEGTSEVTSEYQIRNDTIVFFDERGGMACSGSGLYRIYRSDYYISFDLIRDECAGRIKSAMGFWVRPEYKDLLENLTEKISESEDPINHLNRARIYLATGKSVQAREDLDIYIQSDSTDSRAYINRAATEMPNNLESVVKDCTRAIKLDPGNKNSYFLRGLALYDLGEKERACADFKMAIELGFTALKYAEQHKCSEFWGPYE